MSDRPVQLGVIGAGNRGADAYAAYCLSHPAEARVIAVADPDPGRRRRLGAAHGLAQAARHEAWQTLLAEVDALDAVIIATPDREHVEPAVAALAAGLDVLVEKPIHPTPGGIDRLRTAAAAGAGTVTVAHVLRYTPFFKRVRALLDEGRIGRLVTVELTENVGYWHFAHSYVRGNWRRSAETSPMILAKSCHDLDVLRWLAQAPCTAVASFGSLTHFRAEEAPEGAPDRCLDGCPVEDSCPYHCARFYVDALAGWDGPPVTILSPDPSPAARLAALRTGPYGRCVYRCDNDVADHQVVACEFANGVTASLTVTAFSEQQTRTIRCTGTHGELSGTLDSGEIELRRFLPAPQLAHPSGTPGRHRPPAEVPAGHERIAVGGAHLREVPGEAPLGAFLGHAGGDVELMRDFVRRVRLRRDGFAPEAALTSLEESLESHAMAFAAERSRLRSELVHLHTDDPEGGIDATPNAPRSEDRPRRTR